MSYRYYFKDGYVCETTYKMNKSEKATIEKIHGGCYRVVYVK